MSERANKQMNKWDSNNGRIRRALKRQPPKGRQLLEPPAGNLQAKSTVGSTIRLQGHFRSCCCSYRDGRKERDENYADGLYYTYEGIEGDDTVAAQRRREK